MDEESPQPPQDARIQTFLIADVRGYTLFTQQRGDEAAAKLAAKFARIAREAVQKRGGSVIELRGDEALAVFSSARQAVAAAVDLQERLVEETIDDPELPMPVGIGLDAGEGVPVEGGYRGGALNLAARLCGQAGPGEILASRSVTHLARHVEGVRYVDRGKVHLKNLTEPVELVRIVPEGVDPAERLRTALPPAGPPRRRSRAKIAIAAAVALAIAVGATIVLLPDDAEPTIAAGTVGLLSPSGDLEGTVDVGEFPRGLASGAGSLWVADQESGSLIQVDPSTFEVEQRIPVGVGPTGVAIAAGLVWVANTDDRTVSVVDPQAHRLVQTVVVGNGPTGIVADGDRVWVANSVDATVTEIDATDGSVVDTYPVGVRPVALAVAAGAVWVANASDGTISRVVSGDGETGTTPVGTRTGRDLLRLRVAVGRERRGRDRDDDRPGDRVGDGHRGRRAGAGRARVRRRRHLGGECSRRNHPQDRPGDDAGHRHLRGRERTPGPDGDRGRAVGRCRGIARRASGRDASARDGAAAGHRSPRATTSSPARCSHRRTTAS